MGAIPFFFYLVNQGTNEIAITKDDQIIHYSADVFSKYLKKIKSRVKNNIFKTTMGIGGFLGREKYQPWWFRLKKFLFIPYSLTLVFPIADSLYLSFTRKNTAYIIHPFLCIYATVLIIYNYLLLLTNFRPKISSYGN